MGRYKRVKEEEERLRADLRRDSMVNRKKERAAGRNLCKGYLEGGDSDELGEVKQPTPDRLPRVRHPCVFLNFPLLFLGTGGG